MFVMGVDPGLTRCGFAVLEPLSARRVHPVAMGLVRTDPDLQTPYRLAELQAEIRALIEEFTPKIVAVERVFIQKNTTTGIRVAQAAGVIITEAAAMGCHVREYSPNEIKAAVAGDGRADKEMVQQMVQQLLGLAEPAKPADVSDAAAIALCHLAFDPSGALLGPRERADAALAGVVK
ncbi:MAG: crossover junction endodeoxyribonuclease RuvC [Acidimicrobiales bacterium]